MRETIPGEYPPDLTRQPADETNLFPGKFSLSALRKGIKDRLLTWETALVGVFLIAAIMSRFWQLGARAVSYDESLHAYFSWLLATGKGFSHNPLMHGPLLFEVTAWFYSLFGASDAASRYFPALMGVLLVAFLPRLFKPWLGRVGTLATSALLLISPYVMYYSRYIRHDLLVIIWFLLAVYAVFHYLEHRKGWELFLLAAALALMFSTMEITFMYLLILSSYLAVRLLLSHRLNLAAWREAAEFDILAVLATLGAFFSSPIALIVINPVWKWITGSTFIDVKTFNTQDFYTWETGQVGQRVEILFSAFLILAIAAGFWWSARRWWKIAVVFSSITILLFSTFLTHLGGLATGLFGSLAYWMAQQGVNRGAQPWYYYTIVFTLYEYLPLAAGSIGAIAFLARRRSLSPSVRSLVFFLIWWAIGISIALSSAGEKMPWLSTHITVPLIFLSGWWIGRLFQTEAGQPFLLRGKILRWLALGMVCLLAACTLRTAYIANFVDENYTTEYIDYAHGAPGLQWMAHDLAVITNHTKNGTNTSLSFDNAVTWPVLWYLRNYPNRYSFTDTLNGAVVNSPIIIAAPNNYQKVDSAVGNRYERFEVIRIWWPLEGYKNLSWDRIRFALTDPAMRSALWNIVWNRDYRSFAALTKQDLNPPFSWPLSERIRIYVRKDLLAGLPESSLQLNPARLPAPVDPYASVGQNLAPEAILNPGLNGPRNVAVSPDGSLIVVDTDNSRIVRLDPSGRLLSSWGKPTSANQNPPDPGSLNQPWGAAVDTEGNVYVADTWNGRVQKFDAQGQFLLQWGTPGEASQGLDHFWGPRGIAVGQDGRVYVTDTGNKRVLAFDPQGKFLFAFESQGRAALNEPVGIAVGPDGSVYVADTWNQRVAIFNPDGKFINAWSVQTWLGTSIDNKPYLAVDADKHVYITDPEGNRVVAFDSNGLALAEFEAAGNRAGENGYGLPAGIAIDKQGTVWVADASLNRVSSYQVTLPASR